MDPGVALRVFHLHWSCACIIHLPSSSANNGFPKPSSMPPPKSKRGTATEHAKQPVVLKCNFETLVGENEMKEAQADRADETLEQLLYNLADFLIHVLRELCCSDLHRS